FLENKRKINDNLDQRGLTGGYYYVNLSAMLKLSRGGGSASQLASSDSDISKEPLSSCKT
ncbi:hypothetical protein K0M31_011415, partial [Melipona bicolor]